MSNSAPKNDYRKGEAPNSYFFTVWGPLTGLEPIA